MAFEWSSDVARADWWTSRLSTDWSKVSGVVPDGFADYCCIRSADGREGSLDRDGLATLSGLLDAHTTSDRYWAAVWEGFGQLNEGASGGFFRDGEGEGFWRLLPAIAPVEVHRGPKVELPGRSLLLLEGPSAELIPLFGFLGWQSPTAWWPDDQAWIVITEIDFAWTYVGGSTEAIRSIVASGALDAERVELTQSSQGPAAAGE